MKRVAAIALLGAAACSSGQVAVGSGATAACGASAAPVIVATAPGTLMADLQVDASNVYFTGILRPSTSASVSSVPLCGGFVQQLAVVDDGMVGCNSPTSGPNLALTATDVYFADTAGVHIVSKSGGPVALAGENACGEISLAIARSGSFLYWMRSPASGSETLADILRMPEGGGEPTEIATGVVLASVGGVADATNYYWAAVDGTVNRIALTGGPVTVLVPPSVGLPINGLALDATYVYFAYSSTCNQQLGGRPCADPSPTAAPIMRVPIAGAQRRRWSPTSTSLGSPSMTAISTGSIRTIRSSGPRCRSMAEQPWPPPSRWTRGYSSGPSSATAASIGWPTR